MINSIPFFGWILDFIFKVSLAIPFYIVWTGFGIGEKYFDFLPTQFQHPGFWDCVGVFIVVPIIKGIFIPTLVNITQNVEKK